MAGIKGPLDLRRIWRGTARRSSWRPLCSKGAEGSRQAYLQGSLFFVFSPIASYLGFKSQSLRNRVFWFKVMFMCVYRILVRLLEKRLPPQVWHHEAYVRTRGSLLGFVGHVNVEELRAPQHSV